MPNRKYDQLGYGLVERTYRIRCKKCGHMTMLTSDDPECEKCNAFHCPDCLQLEPELHRQLGEHGVVGANCSNCGYEIWGE